MDPRDDAARTERQVRLLGSMDGLFSYIPLSAIRPVSVWHFVILRRQLQAAALALTRLGKTKEALATKEYDRALSLFNTLVDTCPASYSFKLLRIEAMVSDLLLRLFHVAACDSVSQLQR